MAKIWIKNRQKQTLTDRHLIRQMVKGILEELGLPKTEISILLLDDLQITALNKQYRKRNRPTDVLSFPMLDSSFPQIQPHIIGDVVISLETAGRQAAERQVNLNEEIAALLIHGILHLLGYDHEASIDEAKRMGEKEGEIIEKLAAMGF